MSRCRCLRSTHPPRGVGVVKATHNPDVPTIHSIKRSVGSLPGTRGRRRSRSSRRGARSCSMSTQRRASRPCRSSTSTRSRPPLYAHGRCVHGRCVHESRASMIAVHMIAAFMAAMWLWSLCSWPCVDMSVECPRLVWSSVYGCRVCSWQLCS